MATEIRVSRQLPLGKKILASKEVLPGTEIQGGVGRGNYT